MEKKLPLFPLNLVAFPGEQLNLHIFEPRYKQLVRDCLETNSHFGIPSYVLNRIEFGTEVRITELTKTYDDGRMDIKTVGTAIFKIVDYHNPWGEKSYAGGQVEDVDFNVGHDPTLHIQIIDLLQELFSWLKTEEELSVSYDSSIYSVIHKIGLKLDEEYALLSMKTEYKRQQYIIRHLKSLIPMLQRAEEAREKIKMNGHFKHMDPLKF
ncbi:MAG: LON peptidase substrate-binding domain-containing protein [Cyclobacteriaceae bacterium]